jgi:replicative superfamily II helicase
LPEAQTEKVIPSETGAQMGPESRREAPPPQAKEPPKPDIVEALIAQLTPPESMAKPAAPTAEGIMAQAKALGPQGDALAARRQIAAEREKAIARMPDLEAEGIKALEEAKAARKALLEQRKADDSWRSLRAFFNQLYTRGNDFAVVQDGIRVREEQDKLADLNHAQAVLKLRAAQQAKALGKFDRADELEKDALEQENKSRGHLINTFQVAAQLAGQVNNTDSQWISHALNRRSSEVLKLAELRNSLGERKDNDAVNRIKFLQQQLNAALDDVNKIKSKPLYQTLLSTIAIKNAKNEKLTPAEEAQLATMRKEIQDVEEASNYKNLRSLVDAEIAKYTGVAAPARQNRMRFDIEGKPVQ